MTRDHRLKEGKITPCLKEKMERQTKVHPTTKKLKTEKYQPHWEQWVVFHADRNGLYILKKRCFKIIRSQPTQLNKTSNGKCEFILL